MTEKTAKTAIDIRLGIPQGLETEAATLYWEAFGRKLGVAIGPRERGIALLAHRIDHGRAVAAMAGDELIGLAGFHLEGRSLANISATDILRNFGWLGGLHRVLIGALLDRTPPPDKLLMDGIVVRSDQRGQGVGSRLLERIFQLAAERGKTAVQLDVVDTNPGARRLYERHGFVATKHESTPYLRKLMGFGATTTMERAVGARLPRLPEDR